MTISYSCDIIEGTIVKRKHLQKYVSRTKEPQRTYRRRSTFGSGNDSQQWINYLEEYTEPIVELMKLTRNKRHFYQRGRASRNLAQARFLAIFVTPPGQIEEADTKVHKAHRKYEGAVAVNELTKKKADVGLGKHLHGLRPGYARLGIGLEKAENRASERIEAIKAKLLGGTEQ